MRGDDSQQHALFAYVHLEQRISERHPLRPIRKMVDAELKEMSGDFDLIYWPPLDASGEAPDGVVDPNPLLRPQRADAD